MVVTMILEFLTILATALAVAAGGLYLYIKWQYSYWSKKKVPHFTPSVPFGNIDTSKNLSDLFKEFYNKSYNEKVYGCWLLHKPTLLVNDLDLARKILIQDFSTFHGRGTYVNEKEDPLSNHLFAMEGAQWKSLRSKLSPTFTSGKLKNMFEHIEVISKVMQNVLETISKNDQIFEAKDFFGRFATDVISSCAFGFDTNSLENPDSMFRKMGKKVFEPTAENLIRNSLAFFLPDLSKVIRLVQFNKELTKFFRGAVLDTINYRETKNVSRNDFLQLLIQLKNKGFIDDVDNKQGDGTSFTEDLAAAQAFLFFVGGYETTATSLLFIFYELARNPELQEKLRKEILNDLEKNNGKMTYDGVFSLEYMGKVINESLRMYSPAPALLRVPSTDYKIPELDLTIDKGILVFVNIIGIHYDPKYYPNPKVFDPERFSEEEIAKRPKYTHMPFGEGPRFCIGQRFAYMQIRAALYSFLSKYKVEICDKTPDPLVLDPKSFSIAPIGSMHLKVVPI